MITDVWLQEYVMIWIQEAEQAAQLIIDQVPS